MLGDYLKAAASRPWQWGVHDCCTFPGGWVIEQTGFDPVALWRGRYSDEAGANRFITGAGGIVELWVRGLDGIALSVDSPAEGDIGVVDLPSRGGAVLQTGGIFTGRRWAFLAQAGLHCGSIDPASVLRVWRV